MRSPGLTYSLIDPSFTKHQGSEAFIVRAFSFKNFLYEVGNKLCFARIKAGKIKTLPAVFSVGGMGGEVASPPDYIYGLTYEIQISPFLL